MANLLRAARSELSLVTCSDVQLAFAQANQHRLSATQAQPDTRRIIGAELVAMSSQVQIVEEPRTDEDARNLDLKQQFLQSDDPKGCVLFLPNM